MYMFHLFSVWQYTIDKISKRTNMTNRPTAVSGDLMQHLKYCKKKLLHYLAFNEHSHVHEHVVQLSYAGLELDDVVVSCFYVFERLPRLLCVIENLQPRHNGNEWTCVRINITKYCQSKQLLNMLLPITDNITTVKTFITWSQALWRSCQTLWGHVIGSTLFLY